MTLIYHQRKPFREGRAQHFRTAENHTRLLHAPGTGKELSPGCRCCCKLLLPPTLLHDHKTHLPVSLSCGRQPGLAQGSSAAVTDLSRQLCSDTEALCSPSIAIYLQGFVCCIPCLVCPRFCFEILEGPGKTLQQFWGVRAGQRAAQLLPSLLLLDPKDTGSRSLQGILQLISDCRNLGTWRRETKCEELKKEKKRKKRETCSTCT